MKHIKIRDRLLGSTVIGGALAACFAVVPAMAQDKPAASEDVQEVVVTGSRIRMPNIQAISPITTVGAEEIKSQGVTRTEDLINSLPQAFAGQGSFYSNGSSGTATVNLRGLGAARTLVLVNGRRLGPGTAGGSAADLNFIPSALVKRVDIVTGGASTVYGSDAIAGVVNFLMNDKFEGLQLQATASQYMHKNDNTEAQAANRVSGFALPEENVTDGKTNEFSIVFGGGFDDGRGHITAYATYNTNEAVLQANRDYSACSLTGGDKFVCGGSGTANPARVGNFQVTGSGASATLVPRAPAYLYNFGPTNYYMRPAERYTLGSFATYKINDHAEAYGEFMFMSGSSTAQIAPGGIFASTQTINCDNAFATAQQLATMCGANAGSATANFRGVVARRNVEGGGRQSAFTNSNYRLVTGMRGEIVDGWTYDAYMSYFSVTATQDTLNYFMTPRITNALIARKDASGKIVCQSVIDGTDPACVPYNLFSAGGVTAEALSYLQAPGGNKGVSNEKILSLSFAGDLGQYGFKTPWAETGIGVAFGFESRKNSADFRADYLSKAGLLSGSGGAAPDVSGKISVKEFYGEARIPIAENRPGVENLSLELGFRSSDYELSGKLDNYKIGLEYAPFSQLRTRASFQRASRAPNINELFTPQVVGLDGSTDPCAGTAAQLAAAGMTREKCARTGVTAAQYGNIEANPAAQYNGLGGGNTKVKPEVSDTLALGFVAQPDFVPGLTVSVDYFDIKVEDFIGGVGADLAITRCADTGNAYFCGLIKRDANGSLFLSEQGYIINTTLNVGSLQTKGVDFNADYSTSLDFLGFGDLGDVKLSLVGTLLQEYKTQPLPGDPSYDCAGYFGSKCGTPNPEWRHKARVTWNTPFKDLAISAQWRHFSSVDLDATSEDAQLKDVGLRRKTDLKIGAYNYVDLSASMSIMDNYTIRGGINNVFDRDPPIIGDGNGGPAGPYNGNTFAQVYDVLGRYAYVTLTAKF
ncbi:MAG: TonB-dependent receptor domain-containing protein [Asticcacaulis sp.]